MCYLDDNVRCAEIRQRDIQLFTGSFAIIGVLLELIFQQCNRVGISKRTFVVD